ncbi:MAG: RNA polymerase sigma factor [Bacteroidota bacterium]|nr:RNA polymerase sigma factor [Candidatus Kapabacteria bacterium]MCS7302735.1 RNA polymerase sigma factor [Candidatus Kapabacteria bacterium]MCX7937248.1 RNA polymerase sigma factor [Chlorobiota bacterium]MDW8075739.1 RNA polymerase sigma factor [Bacteroidota bacterium]MDW8272485.1 RNA polymerase sigma factor [Bacteroidota bacterium]
MSSRKSKYASLSDEELYALMVSGSERQQNCAFEELYNRHSSRVYLYCLKTLGDPAAARDACQDVFIAFWRSASPTRQMTNLRGYLLRITRNTCLLIKRDEHHFTTEFDETSLQENWPLNPLGEAAIEHNELAEIVTMALQLLPSHYREAIVLQCYNNLTYQEVADVLGVPLTTVRNWIVRAKAALRKILEPYWQDNPTTVSEDEFYQKVTLLRSKHYE